MHVPMEGWRHTALGKKKRKNKKKRKEKKKLLKGMAEDRFDKNAAAFSAA